MRAFCKSAFLSVFMFSGMFSGIFPGIFPGIFLGIFMSSEVAHAVVAPHTFTSEDPLPAHRWVYGIGELPKGYSLTDRMARAKRHQLDGAFSACAKELEGAASLARKGAADLSAWLLTTEIECAAHLSPHQARSNEKNPSIEADLLERALAKIDKNEVWIYEGPQSGELRRAVFGARLALVEHDLKSNRKRAKSVLERGEDLVDGADEKERARYWRLAGDLMALEQKNDAARELYKRSLSEVETDEVRAKLATLEPSSNATLSGTTPGTEPSPAKENGKAPPAAEASDEEQQLVDRVTTALKSGELVTAVSDSVKLINSYPGGTRAKWAADRILEAYGTIADKSDLKLAISKSLIIKEMERVDADRQVEWARVFFNKGQWEEALQLLKRALESGSGARTTAWLDLAAKCAIATERFDQALDYSRRLIRQHSGTSAAREALLRSGLIQFRQGKYAQAAADLEKLIALPQAGTLEMSARYWLWRSLEKLKSDKAGDVADDLMKRFSFGYYGLRARYERNGGTLEYKQEPTKASVKFWFTDREQRCFERAKLLLQAGWLEEAQSEIKELPLAKTADEKAVRALLWAAAGQYVNASKLANDAWDEKPEFRRPPFVTAAFPNEFGPVIASAASARKLDRDLVRGLIKQESGFNARAMSSANAMGLMQMVPGTAKELARDLKFSSLDLPEDMFKPAKNIQMGTLYLSRLITKYQGHVPLALAAYNAGPARIDRWLKLRPSLKALASSRSSAPEDEIWIDELPYPETMIYVKSILRNILMYRMLDQGRVQIPNPVWTFSVTKETPAKED